MSAVELFFEIGTEEIPAGQLEHVRDRLALDLLSEAPTDLAQGKLACGLLHLAEQGIELGTPLPPTHTRTVQRNNFV